MLRTAITVSRARPLPLPRRLPRARAISITSPRSKGDPAGDNPNPKQSASSGLTTLVAVGIGFAGVYYYHLEKVPQTGRRRLLIFGEKWDSYFAEQGREDILSKYGDRVLPPNHRISKQVRRVVTRILNANKLGSIKGEASSSPLAFGKDIYNPDKSIQKAPSREWEVIVIDEPRVANAYTFPGIIFVFTGVLPACRDDDGLAAVLAHEIGHVVARHNAEGVSSVILALVAYFAISTIKDADFGLSRMVYDLLFNLPNSRVKEYEADTIGLTLMSRACYDPKGAPEMFRRLGELDSEKGAGGSSPEFLNTHPSSESRVEALENKLAGAYAVRAANPDCGRVADRLKQFMNAFLRGVGGRGF